MLFFFVMLALRYLGPTIAGTFERVLHRTFTLEDYERVAIDGIGSLLEYTRNAYVEIAMPLLATIFVVAALGGFLQVGFSMNFERVKFRWGKLDPIAGFKKLFSLRSVFTVGLSMLKLLVVGVIVYITLRDILPKAQHLSETGIEAIFLLFTEGVFTIGLRVATVLLVLGIADLLWQRWRHAKDLMMTKEDVKEDGKRSEGDPKTKGRIRQIQRDLARARMMKDAESATVVVRNPVHYAVALRYEAGKDTSPRVVAKGRNLIALRIIAIAEREGVPVRTDPPLARQLYRSVKLGRQIPEELFRAVAKVLAWVYQHKGRRGAPAGAAAGGSE